ncbi:MAG: hypothetical protein HY040_21520 [Planctomycetes bacterium]|nr:hypothetical protein [Planctomycetota bacterium]
MLRETNRFSGYTDDNQAVIIFEFTSFADAAGADGSPNGAGQKSLATRSGQAVTCDSQGVYRIVATGQIVRTFDGRMKRP